MFLWKIADLSEEDFEIKTADRINNLNNLSAVDMKYIDSNIASTWFYIAKARALWRDDLAWYLQEGIQKLQKRKTELERSITSK